VCVCVCVARELINTEVTKVCVYGPFLCISTLSRLRSQIRIGERSGRDGTSRLGYPMRNPLEEQEM